MGNNNIKPLEPEEAVCRCLRELVNDNIISEPSTLLFGGITAGELLRILYSAQGFINHTKFELGEDWGK